MVLDATVKGAQANSYVTVARASEILGRRLYTTAWDSAASTPDAKDYQVSGAVAQGQTSIPIAGGEGTFTVGSQVKFGNHDKLYVVQSELAGDGTLVIAPGLKSALIDDELVIRKTANEREKALMWATMLLDQMLVYYGTIRTRTQALRNPRSGVYDADGTQYDYDTIPEILEIAVCEMAIVLLEKNKFELPSALGQGVSDAQLGPMSATIDKAAQEAVIPDNILALLSPIAFLESEASHGSRVVGLRRV